MLVKDVGVKGPEEQAGGGALVVDPDASGVASAAEVRLNDSESTARGSVVRLAIEREA